MRIGDRIKQKREELGISMEELGLMIGKNRSTIYRYENGDIEKLPTSVLEPIAKALQTTPAHLMGWDETLRNEVLPYAEYPFVPDPIAAGIPSTIEGIEELPRVVIPDDLMGKYARKKNILIMRVNGESMNRVIENGSIIAVKTDVDVNCLKDGDLVVFNHDYEFSLKRFYRTADRLIFKPDSTDVSFMDISYSLDDDVRIVGKVVMSSISYE